MKSASRLLSLALLAVLGGASAQSITSVTSDGPDPSMAELGDTLTIIGDGLGGPTGLGKPAAFLLDPLTAKKFALSVVTFSDTEITALVTKAAYGVLDLLVQPKGGLLLTLEDALTVPQPVIDGVSPLDETGTIGTQVTITGTGLLGVAGLSKPKVQLFHTGTGKKYSMKVVSFSPEEVVATITKAVAGSLELQLIPKGGATLVASADFTVPLPNVSLVTPGFAYALETVTLDCEHVGNKKPKVRIGKKSAKVLTFSDTQVTFLMPKKLPKGVQTLTLTNKIGTATMIGAIINQGDVPDTATDDLMTATVGKTKFVAGGALFFSVFTVYEEAPPDITTSGVYADPLTLKTISGITVHIPFDPSTYINPVAFVDTAGASIEHSIPDPDGGLFDPPLGRWSTDAVGGSASVTVLDVDVVDANTLLMRAAFSGTLVLVEGTGTETLTINDGLITTTFEVAP